MIFQAHPEEILIIAILLLSAILPVAYKTLAFPNIQKEDVSKKGIQGLEGAELGASHVLFNIVLSNIISTAPMEGWESFDMGEKTYYWNRIYCQLMADKLIEIKENREISVYCVLLSYEMSGLTYIDENSSAVYYAFDTWTDSGQEMVKKVFELVGKYWGEHVDYWIMGNEVNDSHQYYEMGTEDMDTYVINYEKAMRLCYDTMTRYNKNATVLVSLDHVWNWTDGNRFNSRTLLEKLAARTKEKGDYNWGVAYHPYPEPLSSANFWDDENSNVTDSIDTMIITLNNIDVLTNFMNQPDMKFGERVRPIALTECGFNAYEGDKENETLQAAAFTYAYYKVEANPDIISLLIRAYQDNVEEEEMGYHFGLLDMEGKKREIYDVFRYIGTTKEDLFTDKYKEYFQICSWNELF